MNNFEICFWKDLINNSLYKEPDKAEYSIKLRDKCWE